MAAQKDQEQTCEQRIERHMAGRLDDFRMLTSVIDETATGEQRASLFNHWGVGEEASPDEVREAAIEAMEQLPLSIDKAEVFTVLLSTGGPHDEFQVTYDRENDEVTRIEYVFQDWFDGARRALAGDDFDAAEAFARFVTADFYAE